MSHIATVEIKVKDLSALKSACDKMGVPIRIAEKGSTLSEKMYSTQRATGQAAVDLPTFKFPVVFDVDKEEAYMDTWPRADVGEFDKLKQNYAAEVARKQMQNQGWMISESVTEDGVIELTCTQ